MLVKPIYLHIFPRSDDKQHNIDGGPGDCWCEPLVVAAYCNAKGIVQDRVLVHNQICKRRIVKNKGGKP